MWSVPRNGRHCFSTSRAAAAAKQGKPDASSAAVPPPPPTVAPKAAPERKAKLKSAYRRKKQSTEERKQQQEEDQQLQAELRAGHEVYLSPDALAARAAAVHANQGTSQAAWRHVVQPVTQLVPALLEHHHSSRRSSSSKVGAGASTPTLLVIDGYNLLHQHPSTKALLQQRMDLAQMQLHQLLRAYCQQHPRTHVLLVYDAHSVAQRAQGSQNVQVLGDRVTTLYTAGKEADTVIIDLVIEVLGREVQAQSQLGPNTPTLCSLVVHTNDNRIKQAVTEAVFNADRRTQRHALRVTPSSNSALSETLQRVENKLQGQQQRWSRPGEDLPDPQHHTEAWARAVLARHSSSSSSSSSWDSDSDSDDSGGKRRRRRQTQQQQWEQQQLEQQLLAEQLAASLGDEQLLQLAAAGSMDVAAAATASAALEGDADALQPHPAAAAAAAGGSTLGSNAAAVAAAAAAAASSSSSAASRELDELLNMDFDSMLDDLL